MKFSLILATLGRTEELETFLNSLKNQTYPNFELIIVDQNPDDRLVPLVDNYASSYRILHLRSAKGLSKARNVGLKHLSGDVVAFPDDDCSYPPGLLRQVFDLLSRNPEFDGVTGRSVDEHGQDSAGKFSKEAGDLDFYNVWNKAISISIFLKKACVQAVGDFDERLGLGSDGPFQSGEETDYMIRVVKSQKKIHYSPQLQVFHPNPTLVYSSSLIKKAKQYGYGCGRVLTKHHYPLWLKAKFTLRPFLGWGLFKIRLNKPKSLYYKNVAIGRVLGMISKP